MKRASIVSLWRYPVKSMLGEELSGADITMRGVRGDRAFAVIDASTDKVASAASARKWARLLDFHAGYSGRPEDSADSPPIAITLPDGGHVTSDRGDIDSVLSDSISRPVRLEARKPAQTDVLEGTFFDVAVLHLLTTATLDRLRELYPEGHIQAQRFRPNIVIDTSDDQTGFVESDWIGKTLAIGDDVRVRVVRPCVRCVMTTLPQGDLPKEPRILRTVNDHNEGRAGVYASVVRTGRIRRGDRVRLMHESGAKAPAKSAEGAA